MATSSKTAIYAAIGANLLIAIKVLQGIDKFRYKLRIEGIARIRSIQCNNTYTLITVH